MTVATTTETTAGSGEPGQDAPPPRERRRHLWRWLLTIVVALGLFAGFGLLLTPDEEAPPKTDAPQVADPAALRSAGDVTEVIRATQQRLRDLPQDWTSWAGLGAAYVQQARITADPTYYPKADEAFARSLSIHPDGNDKALTGQASLAAARHDFTDALRLTDRSLAVNEFSSVTHGVRGDALLELGRYPEAQSAFQRMLDLKPGLSSFTRASYVFELRGDTDAARSALRRALQTAATPSDAAYCLYYLGELEWNAGRTAIAGDYYQQGLQRDPGYLPLLGGRAKVEAAQGDTDAALRDYRELVGRLPQPSYVIELGDLLSSLGRRDEAQQQYDLVRTEEQLFAAQGVNVDLELSLFEADHGDPAVALRSAQAEFDRRHSILVEDAYAWALHKSGRSAEALPHARASLRLGTRSALQRYHLGVIEAAVGDRPAAIGDLRAALALNGHFNVLQAQDARRVLSQLESR